MQTPAQAPKRASEPGRDSSILPTVDSLSSPRGGVRTPLPAPSRGHCETCGDELDDYDEDTLCNACAAEHARAAELSRECPGTTPGDRAPERLSERVQTKPTQSHDPNPSTVIRARSSALDGNPSTCLKLDPAAPFGEVFEALSERLLKAHSLLVCLTANDQHACIGNEALSGALWAIGSQVDEAQALSQRHAALCQLP